MKKIKKTPLATAMGAAIISTIAATAVHAEVNPFGMTELSGGYMQVAAAEMACGASMNMPKDNLPKGPEGACAGAKKPAAAAPAKASEAKCGQSQCGGMMKDGKMKPGMEAACGAMMKGKEGACGTTTTDDQTKVAPKDAAGH